MITVHDMTGKELLVRPSHISAVGPIPIETRNQPGGLQLKGCTLWMSGGQGLLIREDVPAVLNLISLHARANGRDPDDHVRDPLVSYFPRVERPPGPSSPLPAPKAATDPAEPGKKE